MRSSSFRYSRPGEFALAAPKFTPSRTAETAAAPRHIANQLALAERNVGCVMLTIEPVRLHEATFAVIDVETTGVDPAVDRVVEVACIRVRNGRRLETLSSLVDPGRAIPAVASAIHHIVDRDVRGAPALADLAEPLAAMCADAVVVAHNASFDLRFLPFLAQRPRLCSMRFAMRVIPDAPGYKNQVLRYHLGIEAPAAESAAHRALGDAAVTSGILGICIERHLARGGADDLLGLLADVAGPRALPVLPFGRYRGRAFGDVPSDYLRWIDRESRSASSDARYTARCELQRRAAATRLTVAANTPR